MSLPAWLQSHLETIGAANPDGVSRAARATRCRTCRRPVITGLDADAAALAITCDDQEIDELGECLAVVQGRGTYTLTQRASSTSRIGWQLDPRSEANIRASRKYAVVPEHQCNQLLPHAIAPRINATPDTPPTSTDPPF